jgi:uncharacterized protein (TIGR03084 family)
MTAVPTVSELCQDLAAEQSSLDLVLSELGTGEWGRSTPAAGWDVMDSLSHLCFFEEAAALAVDDPAGFDTHRQKLLADMGIGATPDVDLGRSLGDGPALLERWRQARSAYIDAVTVADEAATAAGTKLRIPWYGPDMSAGSFTTARILEAWAHGVDIRDGLDRPLVPSDRLRHVCHIGYGARAFSFMAHGIEDPGDPVRLEAAGPDGSVWTWGPEDAENRIVGTGLDVALVFAQRRHRGRTEIEVKGPVAELWVSIAQAFAGPATVTAEDR